MRFVIRVATTVSLLVAAAGAAAAQQFPAGTKYGYINLQRVLAESNVGRTASTRVQELTDTKLAELQSRQTTLQGQLTSSEQQLVELQQKLEQGQNVMSAQARLSLQREISRLQLEFQRQTQDAQAEMERVSQDADAEVAEFAAGAPAPVRAAARTGPRRGSGRAPGRSHLQRRGPHLGPAEPRPDTGGRREAQRPLRPAAGNPDVRGGRSGWECVHSACLARCPGQPSSAPRHPGPSRPPLLPLPVAPGRQRRRASARPPNRCRQECDGERGLLPGPLPRHAPDARRDDDRDAGAGGDAAAARRGRARRPAAPSSAA